ncbi:hypothetical protein [Kitasatospora sp. NPDC097691]|uniref:hypothetical protein n=1 Tax=Kitasatospora sp. NPDC097691 TaxID=3157231 RepID=UPI00332D52BB
MRLIIELPDELFATVAPMSDSLGKEGRAVAVAMSGNGDLSAGAAPDLAEDGLSAFSGGSRKTLDPREIGYGGVIAASGDVKPPQDGGSGPG